MIKAKNWDAILYPESLPDDWLDVLRSTHLPFALSPLHDKDVFDNGDKKKPHYHLIICWPGPTTYNKVSSIICDRLNQPFPIPCETVVGSYEYFWHKNDKDKTPYNPDLVRCFNGFDVLDFVQLSSGKIREIMHILNLDILNYDITEYRMLIRYVLTNYDLDYEYVVITHSSHFVYLCRSNHFTDETQKLTELLTDD